MCIILTLLLLLLPLLLQAEHTAEHGWGKPRIVPFGPLQLHPGAQVLHYGMCCFEGMKAYLGQDGRGRLFRCAATNRRCGESSGRSSRSGGRCRCSQSMPPVAEGVLADVLPGMDGSMQVQSSWKREQQAATQLCSCA
jgi:hypothetical protein